LSSFLIGVYELTNVYASFINKGLRYDLFVRRQCTGGLNTHCTLP